MNKFIKRLCIPVTACIFFMLLATSTAMAQSSDEEIFPQKELIVKMDAISPGAGISFQVQNNAKLRALIFFTTSFDDLAFGKRFYLDLTYLRYNYWIISESMKTYWGADLTLVFDGDPAMAPGFLIGSSYELGERFSIFGEVGLNVFVVGDIGGARLGMFNTGVGMKVAL
ncbi:MAG TPA: hypothetical protein VF181_10370 [Balneolaceae bacterium]